MQFISENTPDTDGGTTAVLGYSVLHNGGASRFLVNQYPCNGECSNPTRVQQFYQELEKGFQNENITFQRLENNTYLIQSTDGNGYVKIVMHNDTVYLVYSVVDVEHWSSSKGALQEIINSFKNL